MVHSYSIRLRLFTLLLTVILAGTSGCGWTIRTFSGLRSPVYVTNADLHAYYVANNLHVPPSGLKHRVIIKSNLIYRVVHRENGIKYLRTIPSVTAQVDGQDTVIVNSDLSKSEIEKKKLKQAREAKEGAESAYDKAQKNAVALKAKAAPAAQISAADKLEQRALIRVATATSVLTSLEDQQQQLPVSASVERLYTSLRSLATQNTYLLTALNRYSTAPVAVAPLTSEQQQMLDIKDHLLALDAQLLALAVPANTLASIPAPSSSSFGYLLASLQHNNRLLQPLATASFDKFQLPANVGKARFQSLADSVVLFTANLRVSAFAFKTQLPSTSDEALQNLISNPRSIDDLTVQVRDLVSSINLLVTLLNGRPTPRFHPSQPQSMPLLSDIEEGLIAVEETRLPSFSHSMVYGVDWGALVIPFKIRPRASKRNPYTGQVLHFSPEFSSDFTAGTMLAYRYRLNRRSSTFNSYGSFGLGFGATNIDYIVGETAIAAPTTATGAPERQNRWGATVCVPVTLQLDRFNIGFAVGADYLYGEASRTWVYQGKPWIGIGFGVSFLQAGRWERD